MNPVLAICLVWISLNSHLAPRSAFWVHWNDYKKFSVISVTFQMVQSKHYTNFWCLLQLKKGFLNMRSTETSESATLTWYNTSCLHCFQCSIAVAAMQPQAKISPLDWVRQKQPQFCTIFKGGTEVSKQEQLRRLPGNRSWIQHNRQFHAPSPYQPSLAGVAMAFWAIFLSWIQPPRTGTPLYTSTT